MGPLPAFTVDSAIPEEVIQEVLKLPFIKSAKQLVL